MARFGFICAGFMIFVLPAAGAAPDALLRAVQSDNATAVARLTDERANVNVREQDGTSALAWAAMRSNIAITELLLKAGADPNLANEMGVTPLSVAIANGSTPIAALLLQKGADANRARESGETPLMAAARLGQAEVVKLLIDRGANVNAQTKKFGQTAVMWAAGYPAIVRLLLQNGADPSAVTATWEVKYTIYAPTTVTLGKTGIPWNTDGEYTSSKGGQGAIFFAVQKHDLESARLLLEAGVDVNRAAADGTTPLLAALYHWDPPSKVFIPGKGAPAASGSSQALHADLAMARFLLEHGAKAAVADSAGYTPLHGAALAVANAALGAAFRKGGAYRGNQALLSLGPAGRRPPSETLDPALAIVHSLLEAGADPNRQTRYPTPGPPGDVRISPAPPGSSAFHIAGSSTNLALVKMLAAKGGNPNLVRKDGHTPLTVAVLSGSVEVVKEMVACGGDLAARYDPSDRIPDPVESISLPRRNQTIMHIAALGGSLPVLEYLYSQGVRLDSKNSMGETPLDLADHQERYREAVQREGASDDPKALRAVVRQTATTDGIKKLLQKQ
jgi:ankyrin repeat protein